MLEVRFHWLDRDDAFARFKVGFCNERIADGSLRGSVHVLFGLEGR